MAPRKRSIRPARRPLRTLGRILLLLALPIVLPLLAFLVYNRIDAVPNAAAQMLATPPPAVPDADNAWLALLGLGAAEGVDPVAFGRERLAAAEAELAGATTSEGGAVALLPEPLPATGPERARDGVDALCDSRSEPCLDWVARHRDVLERLRQANATRLARYQRLQALPSWRQGFTPHLRAPFVDAGVATLAQLLLADELESALARCDAAGIDAALGRLADEVEFWRRVQAQAQDLVSLLQASSSIHRALALVAEALGRLGRPGVAAHQAALRRVLMPASAPVDWQAALAHEHRAALQAMQAASPGVTGAIAACLGLGPSLPCWDTLRLAPFFLPQDSANRHAEIMLAMARWLGAAPDAEPAAREAVAARVEAVTPPFERGSSALLGYFSHNAAGKILVAVSVPKFPYGARLRDIEGLRRMLLLLLDADARRIAPDAMADFLERQRALLGNPHDGAAYPWDAKAQVIRFELRDADYFRRPEIALALVGPGAPGCVPQRPRR